MATEERVAARTVELKRPNVEKDIPSVSDNAKPRKRTRVDPDSETIALARKKPTRNKKGNVVSKPESSRVRKTYRRRQKAELSSPGHSVIRDVDYDEVPPSTVHLSSLAANARKLPATETVATVPTPRALCIKGKNRKMESQVGTNPTAEVPNDKKHGSIESPKECDPCAQIQCLPMGSVLEDDDPIQSFSSSLHSPSLLPVDTVKVISSFHLLDRILNLLLKSVLETPTTGDGDVLSGSLPGAESLTKPVDTAPSADAQVSILFSRISY